MCTRVCARARTHTHTHTHTHNASEKGAAQACKRWAKAAKNQEEKASKQAQLPRTRAYSRTAAQASRLSQSLCPRPASPQQLRYTQRWARACCQGRPHLLCHLGAAELVTCVTASCSRGKFSSFCRLLSAQVFMFLRRGATNVQLAPSMRSPPECAWRGTREQAVRCNIGAAVITRNWNMQLRSECKMEQVMVNGKLWQVCARVRVACCRARTGGECVGMCDSPPPCPFQFPSLPPPRAAFSFVCINKYANTYIDA